MIKIPVGLKKLPVCKDDFSIGTVKELKAAGYMGVPDHIPDDWIASLDFKAKAVHVYPARGNEEGEKEEAPKNSDLYKEVMKKVGKDKVPMLKMNKIKEWSVPELWEQWVVRRAFKGSMVGQLYPSILQDEMNIIEGEVSDRKREENS